jgi:hypothetical protein
MVESSDTYEIKLSGDEADALALKVLRFHVECEEEDNKDNNYRMDLKTYKALKRVIEYFAV